MIKTFVFLLLISGALCIHEIDQKCFENKTCRALIDESFKYIDHLVDPCQDILSYSCRGYDKFLRKKSLGHRVAEMRAYLDELLSTELEEDDNEMLQVEKNLYASCLRLADSRLHHHVQNLKSHLNYLTKPKSDWKDIEATLFSLGFGFSFFDMKVIAHPESENENTILLQPPPLENFKNLDKKIHNIIKYIHEYENNPLSSVAQDVYNHYQFINATMAQAVRRFFEKLEEAKLGLLPEKTPSSEYYTSLGDFPKTTWASIIHELLTKENIEFDTNRIILKNPQYFKRLTNLLQLVPRDIIVSAIFTKAVTESLPYVNWLTASLLGDIDRREFCLKETKLYGASHRLVHDWLRKFPEKDSDRLDNLMASEKIFEKIMSVIRNEIELYSYERSTREFYYTRKLLQITDHLKPFAYGTPYNLYEGLNTSSHSYWENILEYRKFWAKSEFEKLKKLVDVTRPFSFIDQDEAQNRFIIISMVNIADMRSPSLPKEVHYGTFGVRTARLIISLLHEDTYNDDDDVMKAITKSLTYPKYTDKVELCIRSDLQSGNSVTPFEETITHILALNTAQKALKHDDTVAPHDISNTFLSYHKINQTKLFLFSYVQDNCGLDGDMIDEILSFNPTLNEAFPLCEKQGKKQSHHYGETCILGTSDY